MRTTAIFVEILITGMQASIWITLFILSIFGWEWIPKLANHLKDYILIVTIPSLAFFYTLGLVFDPVWIALEYLVKPTKWFLTLNWTEKNIKKYSEARPIEISKATDTLGLLFQRMDSRVAIARATFYNSLMTLIAATLFLITIKGKFDWIVITVIGVSLFIILVLSYFSYCLVKGLLDLKRKEIKILFKNGLKSCPWQHRGT